MIELLTDFDQEQTKLKKETIHFNGLIPFNSPDQKSLFIKDRLSFDKYELQKIVAWQEFDRLFRPFKEYKELKQYVKYANFNRKYFMFNMLSLIIFSIIFGLLCNRGKCLDSANQIVLTVIFCLFIVYAFSPLCLNCYQMSLRSKCYAKLQQYCINLSNNNSNLSIITKESQIKYISPTMKKLENCLFRWVIPKIYCIEVQSRTLKDDLNVIKLYAKAQSIIFGFSCSQDKPLFQKISFKYDDQRLKLISDFESIEAKIRPIKGSQLYKKYTKWCKLCMLAGILYVLLTFIPTIFILPAKQQNEIYFVSYVIGIGVLATIVLIRILRYIMKLNGLIALQIKEYCEKISVVDKKVNIIVHMWEMNQMENDRDKNQLFCLEIRKKVQQDCF